MRFNRRRSKRRRRAGARLKPMVPLARQRRMPRAVVTKPLQRFIVPPLSWGEPFPHVSEVPPERIPRQRIHPVVPPRPVAVRRAKFCQRRAARKAVLFEYGIAGSAAKSPGKRRQYRRTALSDYSCR